MTVDNQELDALAEEYKTYGCSAFIMVAIFLIIFGIVALPGLMQFPLHEILTESKNAPQGPLWAGLGGMIAAALAMVAVIAGPVFIFLLSKFLKQRTHYSFCKFAANYLSCYRPGRPILVEKTLNLLRQESIRNSFRN